MARWARFDLSRHSLEHQAPAPESGSGARTASSSSPAPFGPSSTAIQWVSGRESSAILIIMASGTEMSIPIDPSTQPQNTGARNTTSADRPRPRPQASPGRRTKRRSLSKGRHRDSAPREQHGTWGTAIRHENQFWTFRSTN